MKARRLQMIPILAALALTAEAARSQEVIAPGHVTPNAPLPNYVYDVLNADFAVPVGDPLIKTKFNLFAGARGDSSGIRTTPMMRELKVDNYRGSVRLAGGRGRFGPGIVSGTADDIEYDFTSEDAFVKLLESHDIQLLMTFSGTPEMLQYPAGPNVSETQPWPSSGGRSGPPNDLKKWQEIIRTVVKHYDDVRMPFQAYEVWNEPDGTYQFFTGTEADYEQIYKATVEAIREVKPDAVVAGPTADHHMLWNMSFIDFVHQNHLPLDQYTFHEYGSGEIAARQADRAASSLNRYPEFNTTTLSLDEYHDGICCNWCENDIRNHYDGASEMLHDFAILLSKPELTSLSWAWWMDTRKPDDSPGCMGLLDYEGHPKAVYNAWKAYAMMPVDRRQVTVQGPVEGIASTDGHTAGLLMWNRSGYDQRVDIHLKDLPFQGGTARLYRIDKDHASFVDGGTANLEVNETYPVTQRNWAYLDYRLPKHSTLFIEVDDGSGISEETPVRVGHVIRLNRYYPARGRTASWSDFDRRTWIARLGMQNERTADERLGVLADQLPDTLDVAVEVVGTPRKLDTNSLLAMRVDYRVGRAYTKAVLFHGGVYDAARQDTNPWGLKEDLDQVVEVPDLSKFQVPLRRYAPARWNGTVHLSFYLRDTGPDTQAKFTVRGAK